MWKFGVLGALCVVLWLGMGVGCGTSPVQEGVVENAGSENNGNSETTKQEGAVVEGSTESGKEPSTEPSKPGEPKAEPSKEPVNPPQESGPESKQDGGTQDTVSDTTPEQPPENPPATLDYSKDGPLATRDLQLVLFNVQPATGCVGGLCSLKLYVTIPTAGSGARKPPYPLAIVTNGFLLPAAQYTSYAKRLATWGYIAIRWDTNGENILSNLKHDALGKILVEIMDWANQQNTKAGSDLKGLVNSNMVVLAGHSRGGKASALAAQADARVVAFFGIDPVDSNPPGQTGASAVKGMGQMKAAAAVIGADKSAEGLQACAPKNDNYEKFYDAAKKPAWEILLKDVGHMQFLDSRATCLLACLACGAGATKDTDVREITQTALVAWAEKHTRNADITAYLTGAWLKAWVQKGRLQSRNK